MDSKCTCRSILVVQFVSDRIPITIIIVRLDGLIRFVSLNGLSLLSTAGLQAHTCLVHLPILSRSIGLTGSYMMTYSVKIFWWYSYVFSALLFHIAVRASNSTWQVKSLSRDDIALYRCAIHIVVQYCRASEIQYCTIFLKHVAWQ